MRLGLWCQEDAAMMGRVVVVVEARIEAAKVKLGVDGDLGLGMIVTKGKKLRCNLLFRRNSDAHKIHRLLLY